MTTKTHPWSACSTDAQMEEFIELVCSDAEWVAAEFEALIAAQWPTEPPAHLPVRRSAGSSRLPGGQQWREDLSGPLAHRPWRPGLGEWTRERSPPGGRTKRFRTD